ncbi:alpha/beta hydrolase family protein [Marinobacter lutaoensis]|uniref:alpha/beta hydrolase family protein n=1 Tax=Marinobacter lutaoensis TaxID=135739 RepID=UPI001FE50BAE|nr:prolyl oligopeptidase family serine peptidase [Marinobacter lutaoensis]
MPATRACCTGAEPASRRPISAWAACAGVVQRAGLVASAAGLFWLEAGPGPGRVGLYHHDGGTVRALEGVGESLGSRVNGYGGGTLAALPETVVAVTETQRLVAVEPVSGRCRVLAAEPGVAWGGLVPDPRRERVLAVREEASGQCLMAVDRRGRRQCLHRGEDFYGAPALSRCGRWLAWVSWRLPDMPWVRSRLWLAELNADGHPVAVRPCPAPASGSVQQPVFDDTGLWLLSDHAGWWQPWRVDPASGAWQAAPAPPLDHANAPWQLGERHHCPLPGGGWARVRYDQGIGTLWLSPAGGQACPVAVGDCTDFRWLCRWRDQLLCVARSPDRFDAIVAIDPRSGRHRRLAGGESPPGRPLPRPRSFIVPGPEPVQGFFHTAVPERPRPPVILMVHGGPTSATYPVYDPHLRFWRERGFAVAEVNYRGSTGFGRSFRQALAGHWGQREVDDLIRSARHLGALGWVDRDRVLIQGRSAGGYSTLLALAASDVFLAGASLYGVTDPRSLRRRTHRFESGYLDWLLGDPDRHPMRWRARTPRLRAAAIRAPVIFFQGGRDRVVVPEQTDAMVRAMRAVGGRVEQWLFEDEGHGFRDRRNQARMLVRLHRFYRRACRRAGAGGAKLS